MQKNQWLHVQHIYQSQINGYGKESVLRRSSQLKMIEKYIVKLETRISCSLSQESWSISALKLTGNPDY